MLKQFHINTVAASELVSHTRRLAIYRHFGLRAENAFIWSRCFFVRDDLSNITLGDRSFLNHFCFLENGEAIEIGDNSCLGPSVRVLTTTHDIGPHSRRVGNDCVRKPVKIGKGCWIGAGATILPGVTIGDGCVIGAGTLVHRDCEPDGVYLGLPARRSRSLETVLPFSGTALQQRSAS
ncbi:acyltransferase [Leptolyngbya sp. FACHB-541]|uniref:acyltransferase n=1 Tax=Leptolyngbya sp. FACHB-541 TaxID=2692810 RepID=UPI001682DFF1|nr:acyltransferase [Leptolyngbya sp. FACHB-541]MBD1995398.1 acyltransferase [Leptolyngbya sp. FACHB-541]